MGFMDILLCSKNTLKTRGRPVFRLMPLAFAHYLWKEGDLNFCERGNNFQLWTGGSEGKNMPWSRVTLNWGLSNTPTNLCIALLNFLLFCFILYCYAFVQYCYVKWIQYNAMHKFVGVLDNPLFITYVGNGTSLIWPLKSCKNLILIMG